MSGGTATACIAALGLACLLDACGGGSGYVEGPATATPPKPAAAASAAPAASGALPASPPNLTPAAADGMASATFEPSEEDIPNPDRGFYGWAGSDFISSYDAASVQGAYNNGYRLVFAKIQLDAYRTSDLPASFLSSLASRLASVRSSGMKVTLLFSYDFSATGNDATASQIKRHLEQLRPVLNDYADVIPYMRAGFIGAWGEWHSSKNGNSCGYNSGSTTCATADTNRAIVRDALLANVPPTTQIAFRYPADLIKWYPSPTQQSRAGMHNDCFLAGPSDSGTYSSTSQRDYVKSLSANTAFGGETCNNAETPLRNSCSDILSEGPAYHLAWLNSSDAEGGFRETWAAQGCLDKVSRSMGARIEFMGVRHPARARPGETIEVEVTLRNTGWARAFGPRALVVSLVHAQTGLEAARASGPLLGSLEVQAGAEGSTAPVATWKVAVTLAADAPAGWHDLYLSMPDGFAATAADPRFAMRPANADRPWQGQAWDEESARYRTGTALALQ